MRQPIFYVTTLLLALSLTAQAQSALDLGSQAALRRLRSNMPVTATLPDGTRHLAPARTTDVTPVMMIVEDGVSNEQLEAEGLIVSARRGNFVFASVAIDDVERIAGLRMIRKMQLPRDVQQKTDRARAAVGVDKIHAGEGLPKAYTGKNVVTGIVDGGIDPNNISFDREDGTSRVEYLTHIYSSNTSAAGYEMKEYNRETVRKFTTDDVTALHGTHTLNIMAGGYRGNVTMADQSSLIAGDIIEAPNPYYGMAPNSDIVASCGTLQDFFIAMGIESTLQYASYMGWPAVINLSLGSTTGPHDGTTVLSQYMKTVSDYAIICVSAGNEGDLPIALNKTLKDNDNTVQSFIQPLSESVQTSNGTFKNLRYGQIYIYSNDSTPFDVKAVIYNTDRDLITFQQERLRLAGRQRGILHLVGRIPPERNRQVAQQHDSLQRLLGRRRTIGPRFQALLRHRGLLSVRQHRQEQRTIHPRLHRNRQRRTAHRLLLRRHVDCHERIRQRGMA